MIECKSGLCGIFRLQVFREDGTLRFDSGEFSNLITNSGMDYMGTTSSEVPNSGTYLQRCHVGTGSTAPAFADTALVSPLANVLTVGASVFSASGTSPYFGQAVTTYNFALGAVVGNVSEVGIGPNLAGNLFSRALIVDGGGSPITITVLVTEQLRVTYTLRAYAVLVDAPQIINISGTNYNCVVRASQATNLNNWARGLGGGFVFNTGGNFTHSAAIYDGNIGLITAGPSGVAVFKDAVASVAPYVAGNFFRDSEAQFEVTEGNFVGGVESFDFGNFNGRYQTNFTPAIPKLSTQILKLRFRMSWARFTPP